MKQSLPSDLFHPELELYDDALTKQCVCRDNCEKVFVRPPGCDKLRLETEQIKELTKKSYQTSNLDLNKEYERLCGHNWGVSVVDARCSILAQLGARPRELSYSNYLGAVLVGFAFYFRIQKGKNKFQGSNAGTFGRLVFLAIISAIFSIFGVFGSIGQASSGQLISLFLSVPLTGVLFYFLFASRFAEKGSLLISSIVFSVASNFVIAQSAIRTIEVTRTVDPHQFQLPTNLPVSEKIQATLRSR